MANATIETDYGWQTFDLVGTPGPPDVVQAPELLSSPLSIISACVVHDAAPPAFDMPDVMMRQFALAQEVPGDLQEAIAHERRTERDRQVDDPHRRLEVARARARVIDAVDEARAE